MAGKPVVQVTGAKELRAALKHMGADLKDLTRTNKAAAQPVAERAREIAPNVSGRLSGSTRATATRTQGLVAAGGSAVPYAGPIHFGWRARNISPQPFLYDALDQRKDEVVRVYEERVGELVIRVGRETP